MIIYIETINLYIPKKNYIYQYVVIMIIMPQKGITVSEEHMEYLDSNCIDLTKLVSRTIQKLIDKNSDGKGQ